MVIIIILRERQHYGTVSTLPAGWGNPVGSAEKNSRATAYTAAQTVAGLQISRPTGSDAVYYTMRGRNR